MKMNLVMRIGLGFVIAAFATCVIASATHVMLFLGICFILLGVGIFLCSFASETAKTTKIVPFFLALDFVGMGIPVIVYDMANRFYDILLPDKIILYAFGIGMGSLFVVVGIFICFKSALCNYPIEAECLGLKRNVKRTYTPEFKFTYHNKNYRNGSGETYSYHRAHKKFWEGKKQTIYISERDPYIFRTKKGIPFSGIWLILFGILFCTIAIMN